MGRCRTSARARILWSVLCAYMCSPCSADVDVVVNLAGADRVVPKPVEALPGFLDLSSMDNSDLFVAMCLPGTFSPDHEGVCHDCVKCQANQYEKLACIPTRDRTCANCTVCGTHDIELCQCAVKTSQCVTGDRVCLKVPPSVVNLVVDFTSNGVLTTKQQLFVRSGLAVGFTDWLAMQFSVDPETVELTDFVKTGSITYKAYFRFNEVYGEATVASIRSQPSEFYQGGIYYTFGGGGGRRRLLEAGSASRKLLQQASEAGSASRKLLQQASEAGSASRRLLQQAGVGSGLLTANGSSTSCLVDQNCTEPFTEFQFTNGSDCSGVCSPVPCPPGYSGGPKDCQLCSPGTFKNASGYGDCEECPADRTSPTGANSSEDCVPIQTTTQEPQSSSAGPPETTTAPEAPQTSPSASPTSPSGPSFSGTSSTPLPPSTTIATQSSAASSQASSMPGTTSLGSSATAPTTTSSTAHSQPAATTSIAQSQPAATTSTAISQATTAAPSGGYGLPSSNSNANANSNQNSLNVSLVSSNLITVNVQAPSAPSLPPVFNNYNYIRIEQPQRASSTPPAPSMPDVGPDNNYYFYDHRHGGYKDRYYYPLEEDWGSLLLLFLFLSCFIFALVCSLSTGCPYCCAAPPPRQREFDRPTVRFQLLPLAPAPVPSAPYGP